ncbi:unnamed protein product [Aphanomyces euteiches]
MSSIDKLSIRGIRSFSPGREETIDFNQPLTVILGANGCGKTTIIECLKIACTGLLPPGARSGQSFIHDPKIRGDVEVKGSVRLRFTNRSGQVMLVQRTYRLQQMKSSTKFSAMDGVVRMMNEHGEKVSVNHKCSELDKHIPDLLGVSRAVLESVIFCHQEDSNWPLQEGAVLKKRFDDIFESARYTKALEAIKKLKTDRGSQAKDLKRDLDITNHHVKHAHELKEQLEHRKTKMEALKTNQNAMSDNIDILEQQLEEKSHELDQIKQFQAELDAKNQTLSLKLSEIQQNYRNNPDFKEMSESTTQLSEILSSYGELESTNKRQVDKIVDQELRLLSEQREIKKRADVLSQEKGKLHNELETQKVAVKARAEMACEMGRKHSFGSFPSLTKTEELLHFLQLFEDTVAQKAAAVKKIESTFQANEDELTSTMSILSSKVQLTKDKIKERKDQLEQIKRREEGLVSIIQDKGSIESTSSLQRELSALDEKLLELEAKYQEAKENSPSLQLTKEIQGLEKEMNSMNFDLKALESTVKILRGFERDQLNIELVQNSIKAQKHTVEERLKDPKIVELLGSSSTDSTISSDVSTLEELVRSRKLSLEESRNELKQLHGRIAELNIQKKQEDNSISKLRKEVDQLEQGPIPEFQQILNSFQLKPETAIAQLETLYMEAKDKTALRKNAVTFLNTYKKKGEKDKCCPLCSRNMTGDELDAFSKFIAEKMDDSKNQEKLQKAEKSERQAFEVWKQAEALMPSWLKYQSIQSQIQSKSQHLNDLYDQFRIQELNLSQAKVLVDQNEAAHEQSVAGLTHLVQVQKSHAELLRETERLKGLQSDLSSSISERLGANPPTIAQAQITLDKKLLECKDIENKRNSKVNELNEAVALQYRLQSDLYKIKEEKQRLLEKNVEIERAKEEREDLRVKRRKVEDEISLLSRDLPDLERDLTRKCRDKESKREQNKMALEVARQEVSLCQQNLAKAKLKHEEVEGLLKRNIEDRIQLVEADIKKLNMQNDINVESLGRLQAEKSMAEKSLAETESFGRQIRENIKFRKLQDDIETAKEDLISFRRKIEQHGNVQEAENAWRKASAKLTSAKEDRAKLVGHQDNLQENIRELQSQLSHPDLNNIEEKKRNLLIEFETTMLAVSDLDKYYKALDISLMEFHSRKIEEINAIIRSLWQITYRGQDIDTIEIVSGQDGSDSKSKRSYNYRVVMRKDSAMLDMRGRCSAGQKVLAGLVIRLALAETFCLNCGILALDEPTTNLDTANKLGLAQAISDILIAREKQQNFQLICITHDEEFVQMLNRSQMLGGSRPEYFWTVSREEIAPRYFVSKIDKRPWSSDFVYRPADDI